MKSLNLLHLIHGMSIIAAVFIGGLCSYLLAKRDGNILEKVEDYLFISLLSGVVGARLFYFIAYRNQFESWYEFYKIWEGGLVSYGGFVFGGITLAIILSFKKKPLDLWLDYFSIGFLLGLVIGRLGDVLSGEYMGYLIVSDFSIPITMLELIWGAVLFSLMLFFRKKVMRLQGLIFGLTVLLYVLGRFLIDFQRENLINLGFLSISQIVDLVILAFSIIFIGFVILLDRRRKNAV